MFLNPKPGPALAVATAILTAGGLQSMHAAQDNLRYVSIVQNAAGIYKTGSHRTIP